MAIIMNYLHKNIIVLIYKLSHQLDLFTNKMDRHTKEQRRKNMQAVKSSGSKIEVTLAKALWKLGYRYRKNDKSVYGKPDLTMKRFKLAIFVDGEFWHGKNWEKKKYEHKSNKKFWIKKIERNMERDKEVKTKLRNQGWIVMRFWGKDIVNNLQKCISKIETKIGEANKY